MKNYAILRGRSRRYLLPQAKRRHFAFVERRFRCAAAVVMFPPIGGIDTVNIVENHRAEAEKKYFSNVANQHCGVIAVFFERLVFLAIVVAEREYIFAE